MRQVFLDTETTGLSAEGGDRILEIGCIELVSRRQTGRRLHHYINPERSSHPDALRVHGITDDFLADKPRFAEIAPALIEFVRGAELIIHNADFDIGFLNAEFQRLGLPSFVEHTGCSVTDTLLLARTLFPGKSNSLDALCKRLEVDNSQREQHGALLDAGLLAEVYIRMTRGQDALVSDTVETPGADARTIRIDLRSFVLPVIEASAEEAAAHEAVLAELDKASGGKTLWRLGAMA
jgi:DNA polymerase III subunit epsilon